MNTETITYTPRAGEEAQYATFLHAMQARFDQYVAASRGKLYLVDTPQDSDLFERYLGSLYGAQRQYHNCNACRSFVRRYGGLVHVNADGSLSSVLWDPMTAPPEFTASVADLQQVVQRQRIDTLLVSDAPVLGLPRNRDPVAGHDWTHLSVHLPESMRHKDRLKSAGQVAALAKEEAGMLMRALQDFPLDLLQRAAALLRTGQVSRADKFVAPVDWLANLQTMLAGVPTDRRRNLIWQASVNAPAGFTHIRASAVGTLLKDLADGVDASAALGAFEKLIDPANYMKATVPVKAGNIKRAEEVFEKLGIAASLNRRLAQWGDVAAHTVWTPRPVTASTQGLFGHLKPQPKQDTSVLPNTPMTWSKFARTFLPVAECIQIEVGHRPMHMTGLVTASDPLAPPILSWDRDDERNPASWYRYVGGSIATRWGLAPGLHDVTGILPRPCQWNGREDPHWGNAMILLIDGCREADPPGMGLFPEFLRSELREVRRTIEAHSNSRGLAADPNAVAGVMVTADKPLPVVLVVTSQGVRAKFTIDRWD